MGLKLFIICSTDKPDCATTKGGNIQDTCVIDSFGDELKYKNSIGYCHKS